MSELKLDEYQTIFPNSVYQRHYPIPKKPTSEIIVLERYVLPSRKQIISNLQDIAGKLLREESINSMYSNISLNEKPDKELDIEKIVDGLPFQVKKDLYEGNEDCLNFVSQNLKLPESSSLLNRDYIKIHYGTLPLVIINNGSQSKVMNDYSWYVEALNNNLILSSGYGEEFNFSLWYHKGLPERLRLDTLIDCETRESNLFNYNSRSNNYYLNSLKDLTKRLYSSFHRSHFESIPDTSESVLNKFSFFPLIALYELVKNNSVSEVEEKHFVSSLFSADNTDFSKKCPKKKIVQ